MFSLIFTSRPRQQLTACVCSSLKFPFSFCLNSAAIYLVSVCHIQPPVRIQASCAWRQLRDYTGQAILCVCRAVDCERQGEEICSRGDLLRLSVSMDFCARWFPPAHSDPCMCSAGAQSVFFFTAPIQHHTWYYSVYTVIIRQHLGNRGHSGMYCSLQDNCVILSVKTLIPEKSCK